MSKEELKPCPHCGGTARFQMVGDAHVVRCEGCLATTNPAYDKQTAAKLWNMRDSSAPHNVFESVPGSTANLTYEDVRRLVKPLKFKTGNARGWTCRVAYLGKIKISVHEGWGKDAEKVFLDAEFSPEAYTCDLEAHVEAQKLIVELVAAALGVERSAENE